MGGGGEVGRDPRAAAIRRPQGLFAFTAGRDCTDQFPELVEIADVLGSRSVILDGELVCLDDEGRPDFGALRARLAAPPGESMVPLAR